MDLRSVWLWLAQRGPIVAIEGGGGSMAAPDNKFTLDLLGDPADPNKGASGRPRHVATAALRQRVAQLRARGMGQDAIADAIGITAPTLRLHYRDELGSKSNAWRRWASKEENDNGSP